MRKITPAAVLAFLAFFVLTPGTVALTMCHLVLHWVVESGFIEKSTPTGAASVPIDLLANFNMIAALLSITAFTFVSSFAATVLVLFNGFLRVFPISAGEIAPRSAKEFIWMVYALVSLFYFRPILHADFLPTPFTRLTYIALGARIGAGSYFAGVIDDPQFVRIGADSFTGFKSILIPHVMEGTRLAHYPISIGNRVTIGAGAVVLPGVHIGDDAIIGALSVVPKGTVIGRGEVWAGNPARFISMRIPDKVPPHFEIEP